jgi:SulP family sulfate permease
VAIAAATAAAQLAGLAVPHVSDDGALAAGLPGLRVLLVPLNLDTLRISAPAALSAAFVGLLESLLTAQLVDEMTGTSSDKGRESWALGIANLCSGFFGGVAGCAMIGQTVVNVQLGRARSRVSTVVAALLLLALVTALSPVMARIPMVALAGVMMVVALKTIDWRALCWSRLGRVPFAETGVMALTVAVTVATGNLAIGVAAGVLLAKVL